MGSNFEALPGPSETRYDYELDTFADNTLSLKNALIIHNMTVLADCGITLDLNEATSKFGNAIYEPKDFNCLRLDVRVKREYDAYSRLSNSKGFKDIESVSVLEATRSSNLPNTMINVHFNNVESCSIHRGYCGGYSKGITIDEYTSLKVSVFSNGKLSVTGARSLVSASVALEKVCRAIRRRINTKAKLRNITCTNMLVVYNFSHHIVLQLFEKACKGSIYDPNRFSGVRVKIPIKSLPIYYTLLQVFRIFGFRGKYSVVESNNAEEDEFEDSESYTSEDEPTIPSLVPAFIPEKRAVKVPLFIPEPKMGKLKTLTKSGMQRFVTDSTISQKRKVHKSAMELNPIVLKKQKSHSIKSKAAVSPAVSIWSGNVDLLEGGEQSVRVDKDVLKHQKDEIVTANVFTSGNITFTGARSIESIQFALSFIYPFLCQSKARDL